MSATKSKFLFLYRFPQGGSPKPPSPDEMQAQYAAWNAWKAKFEKEVTPGEGLKPGSAAVVKAGNVTDGPFIEAKEVLGSYCFVETSSLAKAIEIAKECPHQLRSRRQRRNPGAGGILTAMDLTPENTRSRTVSFGSSSSAPIRASCPSRKWCLR
jgi:hypothetical protein